MPKIRPCREVFENGYRIRRPGRSNASTEASRRSCPKSVCSRYREKRRIEFLLSDTTMAATDSLCSPQTHLRHNTDYVVMWEEGSIGEPRPLSNGHLPNSNRMATCTPPCEERPTRSGRGTFSHRSWGKAAPKAAPTAARGPPINTTEYKKASPLVHKRNRKGWPTDCPTRRSLARGCQRHIIQSTTRGGRVSKEFVCGLHGSRGLDSHLIPSLDRRSLLRHEVRQRCQHEGNNE